VTRLAELKVYATHPHECSYLPGEEATTLFIDPATRMDRQLYSRLSDVGFRRSGCHIYRPHCARCSACIPVRVVVERFRPNRSQRRIWRRNSDLEIRDLPHIDDPRTFALYCDYISSRHADGDMYPPSEQQYRSFLTSQWGCTRHLGFFLGERLLGVAVCDNMDNGLSAIYTFYDPTLPERGLGTYAVLWQVAEASRLGLDYVYLGYWIGKSRKMSYKGKFRPLEMLHNGTWSELPTDSTFA